MRRTLFALVGLLLTVQLLPAALAEPAPLATSPVAGSPTLSPFLTGKLLPGQRLWVPGQVVVRFEDRAGPQERREVHAEEGTRVAEHMKSLDVDVIDVPQGASVEDTVDSYEHQPLVADAEPNLLIFPLQAAGGDPQFTQQWGLRNLGQSHRVSGSEVTRARGTRDSDIDAPEAWSARNGGPGRPSTVIAILDSGVDVTHPDLQSRLWDNPREADDGRDNGDPNRFVDDLHGWDFAGNDGGLLENNPALEGWDHGTHVAGIAAAARNNSEAGAGTCPNCRLMILKFMHPVDTDNDGRTDTMAGNLRDELEALAYARRMHADIVNASFGTSVYSSLERNAFARLGRAGILAVAAAGNDSLDNDMSLARDVDGDGRADAVSPGFPASYTLPNIVSVAASNDRDRYGYATLCARRRSRRACSFTNWGHDSVDVAAPGVDVLSTVPGGGVDVFDGTSMAAPFVSGIAGLVKSRHPRYSPRQLKNAIMRSVERPRSLKLYALRNSGQSGSFTRTQGRVNALKALRARVSANATRRTDGDIDGARGMRSLRRGRVSWPADVNDVYKKPLRKGVYRLSLDVARRRDVDLLVWKPGTRQIWQLQGSCIRASGPCKLLKAAFRGRGDQSLRFRARRAGSYFFHVSSFFDRTRYRLRLRRI